MIITLIKKEKCFNKLIITLIKNKIDKNKLNSTL